MQARAPPWRLVPELGSRPTAQRGALEATPHSEVHMGRFLILAAVAAVVVGAAAAQGAPFTLGPASIASGPSPFAPGCGGPGEAAPDSVLYQNAEVETHVAVNPTNANNVVTFWQQDRWSDGGAHGNLAGYSFNGADVGPQRAAVFALRGRRRPGQRGRLRASDRSVVSFSPNGRLHAIGLVFDNLAPQNAVLAAFSDDGGATWSTPRVVRFDNPRALGNNFNDKVTLTADPFNSSLVYATWQRIVSPSERASQKAYENSTSYSEAWFARSTNGGQSWEPARPIFRERGVLTQTIGNQVEVLVDGTLINGFNLIHAATNRHGTRGYNVALVRSPDKGVTWSRAIFVNRLLVDEVTDPDTGADVRTGDILPDWAVDRSSNPATRGNVTWSGWTGDSTIPTTTTSCSAGRGTGD
jgi:hypothetical protein